MYCVCVCVRVCSPASKTLAGVSLYVCPYMYVLICTVLICNVLICTVCSPASKTLAGATDRAQGIRTMTNKRTESKRMTERFKILLRSVSEKAFSLNRCTCVCVCVCASVCVCVCACACVCVRARVYKHTYTHIFIHILHT